MNRAAQSSRSRRRSRLQVGSVASFAGFATVLHYVGLMHFDVVGQAIQRSGNILAGVPYAIGVPLLWGAVLLLALRVLRRAALDWRAGDAWAVVALTILGGTLANFVGAAEFCALGLEAVGVSGLDLCLLLALPYALVWSLTGLACIAVARHS